MANIGGMEEIARIWVKYKYAIIILVVGILLMLLPDAGSGDKDVNVSESLPLKTQSVSEELTGILEQIKGVGKVRLMLTVAGGEETIYQYDEDRTLGESGTIRAETVIITDASRNESGLIRQVLPENYRGAVVVCEGGDQPSVRLSVVQAVSGVTGLSSDKITVLKMK